MKFGINNMTSIRADGNASEVLEAWVEQAIEAEELGYWSWWTTEHHFGSDPVYQPFGLSKQDFPTTDYDLAADPLTLLAWVAAKTTRLRVGTGVVILHWDHPVRVAERAALLDTLSHGRLEFGVGRGAGFREFATYDVPLDGTVNNRKFQESLAIVKGLWEEGEYSIDGEFYKVSKLIVVPRPERPLPVFIGSASDSSAEFAGRNGYPYATITWPLTGMDKYKAKKAAYEAAAAAAGVDVSANENPHFLYMYCGESDEEAAATAHEHMLQFQYINEAHYEFQRSASEQIAQHWLGQEKEHLQNLENLARYPVEHQIVGSVETCIERVRMYQEELDMKYMVLNMGYGLMPRDKARASMRRFAEHVMPQFADVAAVSAPA